MWEQRFEEDQKIFGSSSKHALHGFQNSLSCLRMLIQFIPVSLNDSIFFLKFYDHTRITRTKTYNLICLHRRLYREFFCTRL